MQDIWPFQLAVQNFFTLYEDILETSWFHRQGLKSLINQLTLTAALPLPQPEPMLFPSICPPAPHTIASTKVRDSPASLTCLSKGHGALGIPEGKVIFHPLVLNSLKTFENKKVPNPASVSTIKSQR